MDYIKQWTVSICLTLIMAVILSFLSPNGTMGKFYKTIISMFIIAGFLLPLPHVKLSDFQLPDTGFENAVDYSEAYAKQIESLVQNSLEQGGYSACSVHTQVTIKDDEIFIDKLQVAVPSDYDTEVIRTYLYDTLGYQAEVIHIGD